MSIDSAPYTVRLQGPDLIVRGQTHTLTAPVYRDGALDTCTAATVSAYDRGNTAVIDGAAGTVPGGVPTYAIASGDLSSQELDTGWRVEWTITLSTGATLLARNDAALVRHPLWPVVTYLDVRRVLPSLDPSSGTVITSHSDYQDFIDEAWRQIQTRLLEMGNRPNLIMAPSALRESHLYLTLALVHEDLVSRIAEAYLDRARYYRQLHQDAWTRLRFTYDHDDDGAADGTEQRPAQGPVWLGSPRWR